MLIEASGFDLRSDNFVVCSCGCCCCCLTSFSNTLVAALKSSTAKSIYILVFTIGANHPSGLNPDRRFKAMIGRLILNANSDSSRQ